MISSHLQLMKRKRINQINQFHLIKNKKRKKNKNKNKKEKNKLNNNNLLLLFQRIDLNYFLFIHQQVIDKQFMKY